MEGFIRKHSFRVAVTLAVAMLLGAAGVAQQGQKRACKCRGRVVDQQERVIPNAKVSVENPALAIKRTAATDASGEFEMGELPPGSYNLEVSVPSFAPHVQSVKLEEGTAVSRIIKLAIATVSEVVTVETKRDVYQDDLDMSEVRESPAKDVGEALAKVEGVSKVRKGGIANDVVLRGFQHNNINLLIDGARIYGACPGHMDPAAYHVDFAEVERVDVVKGAFDVTSQGSLGGLVKIINKTPGMGLRVKPSFSTGSFGFYNPAVTTSYGTEKFKVLGGYSYRTSDAYEDGLGKTVTSYANYKASPLARRAFDVHTGWLTTEFSPTRNQNLSLGYTRQNGGLVLYPYLLMDANYDNADRVNLKYQIKELSPALRVVRVQTYFTQVKHFMTDEQRVSSVGASLPWSMASNASSLASGGKLEAELGSDLVVGFEGYFRNWNTMNYMRSAMMKTDQNIIPDVDTRAVGGFADYKRALGERVRLNAGFRLDHASMEALSPTANTNLYYAYKNTRQITAGDTNPSGNARVTFTLPKSAELFAGVGSTVRIPDGQERYFNQKKMGSDVVGNPLLRPTRNTEFTVGANLRRGGSYLKPVLFYSKLTDYVSIHNQPRVNMATGVMNTSARSYENVDARMYGGEISYALAFRQGLSVSGGTSYARGIRDARPAMKILDTDLAEMPPLKSWLAVRYVYKQMFTEIGGLAVNRQGRVDADLKETPTAGYGVLNLKTGVNHGKLYATVFVENLLNRYYVEHFSYSRDPFRTGLKVPEPGRNIFAQVSYTF